MSTMRMLLILAAGAAIGIAAQTGRSSLRQTLSLNGEWRYLPYEGMSDLAAPGTDDSSWPTMTLPSNWFLKGSREYPTAADLTPASKGAIGNWGEVGQAPPERGLDYSGHVWFRRSFSYPKKPAGPVLLRFGAVDYFAEVYLNGSLVGKHEGYFQPFEFEVSRLLKSGANQIAVRVGAPALLFDWTEDFPMSWPKRQAFIKGIFGYHDTRPGGTTARGQERGTGGILGDVTIRESSGIEIEAVEVSPTDVSAEKATLRIRYRVRNWTDETVTGTLNGEIRPSNFSGDVADRFNQSASFTPGESTVEVSRVLIKPTLWWSWDQGAPNLYELRSNVEGSRDAEHKTRFGVRSIRRDDKWVWYLNGRRIFPRGSNYISTQWLSQADRAWYERDVKLMIDANLNSIRVHAHLEKPEFYDVADEKGLMVWQDFPLQWGYTDAAPFREEALRQLRDMITLRFNHPSIVLWCMHNEAPHAMEWMKRKVQDQNRALDEALVAEAGRADSTRVLHRDSGTGDGHPYPGWYSGKAVDFAGLPGVPFLTEYGAQALPSVETLRTMFPEKSLWPQNDADWEMWAFHNFQKQQTFELAKVPMGKNIEEFVANSQNYQAALIRFATESYRRAKWTRVTGLYQFMFVEDWPSITWAVVDYYRRPKRGYVALRDSMQPVLPSIEYSIDDPSRPLALWVVNDRPSEYKQARLRWKIRGQEESRTVDIPTDGVVKVVDLGPATDVANGTSPLEVWLEDSGGQALGRNRLEAADFIHWKQ